MNELKVQTEREIVSQYRYLYPYALWYSDAIERNFNKDKYTVENLQAHYSEVIIDFVDRCSQMSVQVIEEEFLYFIEDFVEPTEEEFFMYRSEQILEDFVPYDNSEDSFEIWCKAVGYLNVHRQIAENSPDAVKEVVDEYYEFLKDNALLTLAKRAAGPDPFFATKRQLREKVIEILTPKNGEQI